MTLYLECGMGAAGDMLAAALLELLPPEDRAAVLTQLNALGLPGVEVAAVAGTRCGIAGTHFEVRVHGQHEHEPPHEHTHGHAHAHTHEHTHAHTHEHAHNALGDVYALVDALALPDAVRANVRAVYRELAQAEAHAHGRPVEQVHFHEVGALDAVADIAAVCLLMHKLAPDRVLASPIHVGGGTVRCAHGVLPVPAPATAHLLRGLPSYGGTQPDGRPWGELCTPTGAALLRHFVQGYGTQPPLRVQKIGHGLGHKEFPRANMLRAFWGSEEDVCVPETEPDAPLSELTPNGEIAHLACNLDDMTGEHIGYAVRTLRAAGAPEVCTLPVQMKKDRPGVMLICLCPPADADRFAALMLRHTTTLGVRRTLCARYELARDVQVADTPYGAVRLKRVTTPGFERTKPEFDDVAQIAQERGVGLREVEW